MRAEGGGAEIGYTCYFHVDDCFLMFLERNSLAHQIDALWPKILIEKTTQEM